MSRQGKSKQKPPEPVGSGGFAISSTVRQSLPRVPFAEIAREVLGPHYDLSLVICGDVLARRVIRDHRPASAGTHKTYAPNVLSFPLSETSGEIVLNVRKAEREAAQMRTSVRARIAHLYVHGCFHLLGMDHSDTMDQREDGILARFKLL